MHNFSLILASGAFALSIFALPALAQPKVALSDEEHINGSLLSAAIGAIIANRCDSIDVRRFTAVLKAWQLKNYALRLGYTSDEIDAFVESKTEQTRIRRAANRYLKAQGAKTDDDASYCNAGRAEIRQNTLTGQLIRAN